MAYKCGDYVRIREDLTIGYHYGGYSYNNDMAKYHGKVAKIVRNTYTSKVYVLDIDNQRWNWHESMLEPMYEVEMASSSTDKNNKGIMKMKAEFKITDYKTYDNKVVVVTFEDGTKEKAVCSDMDEFDLERGVEVCVLKHIFGDTEYKSMLRRSMKQIRDVCKEKERKEAEEAALAYRKIKADERKQRRREKRRQRRIEDMKTAYLKALEEHGNLETTVEG